MKQLNRGVVIEGASAIDLFHKYIYNLKMKYETVKLLKNSDFKRLTGVHHSTFEKMLKVVQTSLRNFGRPPKLILS